MFDIDIIDESDKIIATKGVKTIPRVGEAIEIIDLENKKDKHGAFLVTQVSHILGGDHYQVIHIYVKTI